MIMEKYLDPKNPLRCIITGPNECGKSVFESKLFLNAIKGYNKIYIHSPSLHQDLYEKLFECFSKYAPLIIIANILNDVDIDLVIGDIVNNKDFEN